MSGTIKNKILIIKLLGAGNFIAMADALNSRECTIITVSGNRSTIKEFAPSAELILLDETSLMRLIATVVQAFVMLVFKKYGMVINLEAESSFAKLISALPQADELVGLSNKYKSLFDWFFYDYYLVAPLNLSRGRVLENLIRNGKPETNVLNALVLQTLNDSLPKAYGIPKRNVVLVTPTCSPTDGNRRLKIAVWRHVMQLLTIQFEDVIVAFPSSRDKQYSEFEGLRAEFPLSSITIVVESYRQFSARIRTCDLLVTVDSQALHIGQRFGKQVVCFYGPTSPHGVHLGKRTYAISKEFECSPCTHKYLVLPCRGSVDCMRFSEDDIKQHLDSAIPRVITVPLASS
jgi:hypothetical protein